MPVTQKDVAREAGVSQTVVSDVLQGRPRGRVSADTRERIMEAARRLAYRPNASARALRSRRSQQVAYVTTRSEADRFDALGEQIVGGVAGAVSRAGYRLLLEVSPTRREVTGSIEEMLAAGVCDGCVIRSFEDVPELWRELREVGCPIVVIGQVSDPELTSVAHDVNGMVRTALTHLTARGHRRIASVASPRTTRYHQLYRAAWEQAVLAAEVETQGRWIETSDRREAEAVVAEWLRSDAPPTAIVCHDQRGGIGVSSALRLAGRTIGDEFDLFLMSTDGTDWCWEPGTWCLRTDADGIGRRAAEEMLRMLAGEPPAGPIRLLPEIAQLS